VEVKAVGVTLQPEVPVDGKAPKPSGQKQKAKSEAGMPKTGPAKEETRKVENIREACTHSWFFPVLGICRIRMLASRIRIH
jgi:hypothetical protein